MHLPIAVTSVLSWWASAYSDHRAISVAIRFLHIAGLVVAGGTAIATDRTILLAAADATRRSAALATLSKSHYTVVPALVLIVATGVLMTASDTATFFASPVYWTKQAFVVLLLANGYGLVVAERLARQGKAWTRLAIGSAASLFVWLLLLLLGTLLTVAA
jgi:hypothetical protein